MPHRDVLIPAPDGTCDASLHTPEGAGPWPGVILYTDAGGVRGTFRAMAERLAGLGYAVLLPNLYYRSGGFEPFDLRSVFSDKAERARLMELASSATEAKVAEDTWALIEFLAERPEVGGTRIGTAGYCMGGSFALTAAGRYPDHVAAAASFHGGHLASDRVDSPHQLAASIQARVYVACAEDDRTFPQEQYDRLSAALTNAQVHHTLVTYPAGHGFAVEDNPSYDAAADERHWLALEELFASTLTAD